MGGDYCQDAARLPVAATPVLVQSRTQATMRDRPSWPCLSSTCVPTCFLQASAWRELEGVKLSPWTQPPDPLRKAQRLREMEAARLRCKSATSPKIREQVNAIETKAEVIMAVVFHSFHLLLITVDNKGYVRVNNGADGTNLNTFHVSNGAPPSAGPADHHSMQQQQLSWGPAASSSATVVFARQLNEAESNLLLTGAADGAVRVWRAYLNQGLQRMAAAWQAVPIRQPPTPVRQAATFAMSEGPPLLFAVGGCHPDLIQCWDLISEQVMQQVPVRSSHSSSACPVAVDRLSAAQSDPRLLLSSCSDGVLRLFDLRTSLAPVASIHAGKGPLAGMVLEPCGRSGAVVTGRANSKGIKLLRLSSEASVAAWQSSTVGSLGPYSQPTEMALSRHGLASMWT
eukprot:GHRR01034550.1.p1 GENE.GHRR01034550.1~~GHRR01034550.1.p1  ORF type:complete len:399 (+),score=147.66 GHRR01034550.1:297-1493(+)